MNNQKKIQWPLVANIQISEYFNKSIKNNKIGGSYIFSGPDNLGKTTVAKFLAQIMLCQNPQVTATKTLPCNHCSSCRQFLTIDNSQLKQTELSEIQADFHIVKKTKDKKNISIKQIRHFIRTLSMSSFGGKYKIGIIKHANSLSREAANALLKILEEPKQKTIIILITEHSESLPATILSRSQILHFKPVSAKLIYDYLVNDFSVSREKARNIARLSSGRPALARKFLQDLAFYDFYDKNSQALLSMPKLDINERFLLLDKILDKKIKGQIAVQQARRILQIWQGVVRDWLMFFYGHYDLMQYLDKRKAVEISGQTMAIDDLLVLSKNLFQAQIFLRANVNPRLVFEKIVLSI